MNRNGYIDVIKFAFAIIIAEFHLLTGIFPGGRVAVDGFFMISAFLMMKNLERRYDEGELGTSTVSFIIRKYKGLALTLALSAIAAFILVAVTKEFSAETVGNRLPLILFDIFPLNTAGFQGIYVVGISWYLSSMFIALAILFPLIKRFRSDFTLTVCPLLVFLGYGLLSARYGNIAVGSTYLENSILHTGVIRALAGSSAGCLLYEISRRINTVRYTRFARTVFTLAELLLLVSMIYLMHHHPRSKFDYLLLFIIFGMLLIGINGLSYSKALWNPKWTKPLGTASTLIVLNHYNWAMLVQEKTKALPTPQRILIYAIVVALTCAAVYFLSKLILLIFRPLFRKKLWVKTDSGEQ